MLTAVELKKLREFNQEAKANHWPLIFGALSDPTRFCIFRILLNHKNLCVTDIAEICGLSVAAASHQLKILELVGLVERKRQGKMICYEIKKSEPIVIAFNKVGEITN